MSDLSQLFASSLPIEVKPSKPKYAFLLLVYVGVTAFLVWTLLHGQARSTWPLVSIAAITSLCAVASAYALCQKRPLVLLNQQGVTVRGWKGCPVAWDEIERVWKFEQLVRVFNGIGYSQVKVYYVCLALKNSKQWLHSQGRIKRKFASYYHAAGWGDLYFTTKGMNYEPDELVAAIQSHIGGVHLSAPPSLVSSVAAQGMPSDA